MDAIDQIRAFNRFYTRELGLLGRSYLTSGRSLAEARVLHELGAPTETTARRIVADLGMDEAQVSRLLARLGDEGLVQRHANPQDTRQQLLSLNAAGRAALADLTQQSRAAIEAMAGEGTASRAVLARLFGAAQQVLADREGIILRAAQAGDYGWIISEHGALYARDEGYDQRFEALVARILADCLDRNDPRERIFVAELAGQRLGTISCMAEDSETARLRLFLVRPEARGQGLGQRLHDACITFAREQGFRRMVLWTHKSHLAAGALYARNGWRLVKSVEAEAFGTRVVDQDWHINL